MIRIVLRVIIKNNVINNKMNIITKLQHQNETHHFVTVIFHRNVLRNIPHVLFI